MNVEKVAGMFPVTDGELLMFACAAAPFGAASWVTLARGQTARSLAWSTLANVAGLTAVAFLRRLR